MNPYGVGYSGERVEDYQVSCRCCGAEFVWRGPAYDRGLAHACDACRSHDRVGDELEALREHEGRFQELLRVARQQARDAHHAQEQAEQDSRNRRRQTAAALKARNRAEEQLKAVDDLHRHSGRAGACVCGDDDCEILYALDAVRRRQAERYD